VALAVAATDRQLLLVALGQPIQAVAVAVAVVAHLVALAVQAS
jgi:hypothetical protein